ncbi:hypothetical protein [Rheinheimera aquimaris]|uniref:hypothetical protein n=1 Tax=Rheinheimera aquimaris TaxID=412437 RepID=UPI001E3FDD3F|nr:hypothetical protein [Rheinheimera aquimaris]MCD1597481.1 hypothetical protein [Rheinheimera aquimaris]
MANVLVLYQYQVKGDYFKSFNVSYDSDMTKMFNDLPYLYCVNVIQKESGKSIPHGGFIVKSDIRKDDPQIAKYMYETALQLDKVSEILHLGNTIQATPTNYVSAVIPNENECQELAFGAMYLFGWGANA